MGWTRLGPFLDLSCSSHVPLTRDHAPLNSGSLHVLSPSSFCQEDASVFHFLPSLSDETSQHRQLSSWKTSLTPLVRFDALFSVSVASFASPSQDRVHCILSSVLVQFAKSCPSLCDPRDCSMLGLPVPDCLPEFAQVHVHWVADSTNHLILSCPLLFLPSVFPRIGSFPMNQLFVSDGQSVGASVSGSGLPISIQDWYPLGLTGFISLLPKGLSRVFSSSTTIWKHQFFGTQLSLRSNSHICTWLLERP